MGAKCDYRELARAAAGSPRETELVNELLKGRLVKTYRSPVTGRMIVGLAGLGVSYWHELYNRLRRAGLLFQVTGDSDAPTYRMTIPGSN